jgi:NodT family efflux transporter outer membrane factor (OMF) lipoprotein
LRAESRNVNRSARAILAGVTCLGAGAGCALAPPPSADDLRSDTLANAAVPTSWTAQEAAPGQVERGWLATFADPELTDLVAEAMRYNTDLQVAAARVAQAEALVRAAGGELYPALEALGRAGGKMGDNSGLEGWLVSAAWELDLWGRVRYGARSASEQYASAEADFAFARQSLAATVATAWFMATEAALQRDLLAEIVGAADGLRQLAQERLKVGAGSEFEVTSATVTLQTYRDSLRQAQLARVQALRALELLVGRYPGAQIAAPARFGSLAARAPAGLPAELLERRPDVIAARNRVAAAFSLVQQARAARLPSITLTGSVSDLTSDLFVLEDRDTPVWSVGGTLLAPLFTGGTLRAQVDLRTAEQTQALAQYEQTALTAFGEVEDALSSEAALRDRELILEAAVTSAERALQLARTRYRVGAGDLRSVQEQQVAYLGARTNLIRVRTAQRVQRVNLHLALGGDFAA